MHVAAVLFERMLAIYRNKKLREGFVELMETSSTWPPMSIRRAADEIFDVAKILLQTEQTICSKQKARKDKLQKMLRTTRIRYKRVDKEISSLQKSLVTTLAG